MFDRKLRHLLAVALVCVACVLCAHAQQKTLKIAAAADLQPVLPPLLSEFQAQTGIKVEASYASSGTLATQIINGAPFDLFLAADLSFPEKVIAAGLADTSKPAPYARGTLVLWTRNDSPLHGGLSIDTLRNPALAKVAVANPEHAPYGRAAMAALTNLGVMQSLKDKLVFGENIAQAAQYVDSGNAEIGLISLTSALTPRLQSDGRYVEIPVNSYPPILQGAVVIKNSLNRLNREEAHRFLGFLATPAIRRQLAERGLRSP